MLEIDLSLKTESSPTRAYGCIFKVCIVFIGLHHTEVGCPYVVDRNGRTDSFGPANRPAKDALDLLDVRCYL